MKKISSILICLVLGISSAWATQYTHTVKVYARNGNVSTAGGGTVEAQGGWAGQYIASSWDWGTTATYKQGPSTDVSISTTESSGSLGIKKASAKIRLWAVPSEGYYFSNWTGNASNSTTVLDWTATTGDKELGWQGKAKTFYYYAIFKPVTVNSVSADYATIQTVDVNGSMTANITFGVTGADNMNDFLNDNVTCTTIDSRFAVGIATVNASAGTVTIPVTYTDDNHHIMDGILPQITLTLTSKGNVNSTKSITIYAKSNLYPEFTATPSPCDLTPDNPIDDGQTASATISTSYSKTATSNATNVWIAEFVNPIEAASLGYTLDATDPKNPKVSFTPTAQSINKVNVETALRIKCVYTDATPQEVPYEKIVTLSADAGKVFSINTLKDAVMNFDIIDYSETNNPATLEYPIFTTLLASDFNVTENLNGVTYTTKIDGHASQTDRIVVTAQSNLVPDTYISTIEYDEIDGDLEASLTVNVPIKLARPVVNATIGLGQKIQLDWQDVYGATAYLVKSGEVELATILPIEEVLESAYVVTNIAGKSLVIGVEYPFTVTAIYEPNTFGNRTSDEILVKPTVPAIIASPADVDIWTGTEKGGSYPYSLKRKVDLSAAFKDGVAAFEQLYIFGLTSGDANDNITVPTATTNSNAVTPCYIYNKSGDAYVLNQTIENVNVDTKSTSFNIEAVGQKIYFTGYAPYASCGSSWSENGVFYFTSGNDGEDKKIDLYLDNLQIYSRPKAKIGNVVLTKKYELETDKIAEFYFDPDVKFSIDDGMNAAIFTQGSGSVFCFQSKCKGNNKFQPTIHLRNNNILQSTQGMTVIVQSSLADQLKDGLPATQHSSPIQILLQNKNTAKDSKTHLVIDDEWSDSEKHTNGVLNLAISEARPAPTIDLGNEHTELYINGGQLFLSNSFNSSKSYYTSFAIAYRKKDMMDGLGTIYALGDDQPDCKVEFNDGSINCRPLSPSVTHANQDAIARFELLFHNATSMKCPANTTINGGTFNCDVLSCSASDSKGSSPKNSERNGSKSLCLVTIPIKDTNPNGTAILYDNWMEYADENGSNTSELGYYGIASMQPVKIVDGDETRDVVHLMLPSDEICFKEVLNTAWVMCMPSLSVNGQDVEVVEEVPSSISVDKYGLTTVKMTHKFFYAEMDSILQEALKTYQEVRPEYTISIKNATGHEITNDDSYIIYDKIYMLMPIVANQWKIFSPPFDVANVYVVEGITEDKLLEEFGTGEGKNRKITGADKIAKAREKQAWRTIDLFYTWIWSASIVKYDEDLWPTVVGSSTPDGIYENWKAMYSDQEDKPIIEQLYHYKSSNEGYPTGKTRWDANFYLYEVKGSEWTIDEDGMNAQWKEVSKISEPRNSKKTPETIMNKGGIYSISFPYSIVNSSEHDYTNTWDYWTGKYIIFEGYANTPIDTDGDGISDSEGQIISGKSNDWDGVPIAERMFAGYTTEGAAVLRGNATFAIIYAEDDNTYVLNTRRLGESDRLQPSLSHNVFVNEGSYQINPSEGFLLANAPASLSGMPRRIESINPQTGEITYRNETTTSLPTIGGNKHMMVYNIEGGVGIVPVVEQQVSIYNAAGQLVTSQYLTDEVHIPLPSGIYLIAGAKDQFKAVVK